MPNRVGILLLWLLGSFYISCGSGTTSAPPVPPPTPAPATPTPVVVAISPTEITAGTDSSLTITGENFRSDSVAQLVTDSGTTFMYSIGSVTPTQLKFSLPWVFSAPGVSRFRVFNPPDAFSNTVDVSVINPVPVITSVAPVAVGAGTYWSQEILVSGTGLAPNVSVSSSGGSVSILKSPVDWKQLKLLADYSQIGTQSVLLTNPAPGGGTSVPFEFEVFAVNPAYPAVKLSSAPAEWQPLSGSFDAHVLEGGRYILSHYRDDVTLEDFCLGAESACTPARWTMTLPFGNPPCYSSVLPDNYGRFFAVNAHCYDNLGNYAKIVLRQARIYDTCWRAGPNCQPSSYVPTLLIDNKEEATDVQSISDDARRILILKADNSVKTLYLSETCIGATETCTRTTEPASVDVDGSVINGYGVISANGRFIAFGSPWPEFYTPSSGVYPDLYVRDTCYHAPAGCSPSTSRLFPYRNRGNPLAIDPTGRYVRTGWYYRLFLTDTCRDTPDCIPRTTEMTMDTPIPEGATSLFPERSSDGRFTVFTSSNSTLVANDTNSNTDAFLYDNCIGASDCVKQTRRFSVIDPGVQLCGDSAAITPSGEYLFYTCDASIYRVKREVVLP